MMRLSLAVTQDQRQPPAGSLACDPEYADYLRWLNRGPVTRLAAQVASAGGRNASGPHGDRAALTI
jgi:hypothetical protein